MVLAQQGLVWDAERVQRQAAHGVIEHHATEASSAITGAADQLIPIEHAEQLKAAAPAAELWEVPDTQHAGSYLAEPQAYVEKVAEFFERSLK